MSCAKMAEPVKIQTDRQDRQWTDSIGRTVLQTVAQNGRTGQDPVWNAESGGFREHLLHRDVDDSTGRGIIESVWLIEKHRKAHNLGVD